jgi:hypothetical protein
VENHEKIAELVRHGIEGRDFTFEEVRRAEGRRGEVQKSSRLVV